MDQIFRKKTVEKISSPEDLDDYIKVTTPSVWVIMIAIVILLIGSLVWGCLGKLTVKQDDGTTKSVAPITFILN